MSKLAAKAEQIRNTTTSARLLLYYCDAVREQFIHRGPVSVEFDVSPNSSGSLSGVTMISIYPHLGVINGFFKELKMFRQSITTLDMDFKTSRKSLGSAKSGSYHSPTYHHLVLGIADALAEKIYRGFAAFKEWRGDWKEANIQIDEELYRERKLRIREKLEGIPYDIEPDTILAELELELGLAVDGLGTTETIRDNKLTGRRKKRPPAKQAGYRSPPCPKCGGKLRVTTSPKSVRHHKCDECGHTMKNRK